MFWVLTVLKSSSWYWKTKYSGNKGVNIKVPIPVSNKTYFCPNCCVFYRSFWSLIYIGQLSNSSVFYAYLFILHCAWTHSDSLAQIEHLRRNNNETLDLLSLRWLVFTFSFCSLAMMTNKLKFSTWFVRFPKWIDIIYNRAAEKGRRMNQLKRGNNRNKNDVNIFANSGICELKIANPSEK